MFIVLEGLDGIGKSAQVQLLKQHFTKQNQTLQYVHFPRVETPPFGPMIADYLAGKMGALFDVNPYLVASLYAQDQYSAMHALQPIKPQDCILVDRYFYSNMAYQTVRLPTGQRDTFRQWLHTFIMGLGMPEPDIAIYLHGPMAFREKNLQHRSFVDMHEENQVYQQNVHKEYLNMCSKNFHRLQALDCCLPDGTMADALSIHQKILAKLADIKLDF